MKIWIIEPHCDDILYSCPELLTQGDQVFISTFFAGDERHNNVYRDAFSNIDTSMHEITEIGRGHAGSFFNHPEQWQPRVDEFNKQMNYDCAGYAILHDWCDMVYMPAGIIHPHHFLVARYFNNLFSESSKINHYLDRPYYAPSVDRSLCAISLNRILWIIPTPHIDRLHLVRQMFGERHCVGGGNVTASIYILNKFKEA